MSDPRTLLLIDGSSYLYRAFHAVPDLRTRAGEPTGAIRGVLTMLERLRKDEPADYCACVFDAKGKTFRDDVYPEYKANREAMPDDLARQIEPLYECIRSLGWPLLIVEGVEADDVIGTLACEARRRGMRTLISTGDKDLAQLVDDKVTLVNTMSNERLDVAGVEKKFGIPPRLILDYLTLVGDSIDNIPGVDKVGPKTAVKWIQQYGSLNGVIEHAGEIGGVVGANLAKALDWLPKARELLTIKCNVSLPVTLDALTCREPDRAKLDALFERFEFKALRKTFEAAGNMPSQAEAASTETARTLRTAETRDYECVLEAEQLERWIDRIESAELVSIDTETTTLDQMQALIVGVSLAVEPGHAAYIPLAHRYPGAPAQLDRDRTLERLKPWLEDAARPKLGQHAKFDLHVFANHGIRLAGIAHDTLLESYVLESHRSHETDSLAERHLELKTITYDEVTGKGAARISFDDVEVGRATEYSAEDVDITLRLHEVLYPKVQAEPKLHDVYRRIEMPVSEVLFAMERHGVLLDCALLEEHGRWLGSRMAEIEREAHAIAGQPFNLNSPKQITEILFDRLQLPVMKKTPTGSPSTDEDVLASLALDYPLPKLLLDYRAVSKLKSTYTDKLPRMVHPQTGRVHTNYGQAVAVTGRLASNDPNLQNIPVRTAEGRRIREAFIAPQGATILSADYSQIELRIMAHLSQDPGLLEAFEQGMDVHRHTASEVFGAAPGEVSSEQRRYAKVINFGLMYGMSAFGLAQNLGIERSAAASYIERYFARYPGVAQYMQRTREQARSQGYVETVFGRRLWLTEIRSSSPARRSAAERAAINAPMQGTAADLIKLAMIAVHRWLAETGLRSRLIMQVHDELVLEVPNAELERLKSELPRLMTGVAQLAVPLMVEVGAGPNWERAH